MFTQTIVLNKVDTTCHVADELTKPTINLSLNRLITDFSLNDFEKFAE